MSTVKLENSSGAIIINFSDGAMEVSSLSLGGTSLASETLDDLAQCAAKAIRDRMKAMDGCMCDKCRADRATPAQQ